MSLFEHFLANPTLAGWVAGPAVQPWAQPADFTTLTTGWSDARPAPLGRVSVEQPDPETPLLKVEAWATFVPWVVGADPKVQSRDIWGVVLTGPGLEALFARWERPRKAFPNDSWDVRIRMLIHTR